MIERPSDSHGGKILVSTGNQGRGVNVEMSLENVGISPSQLWPEYLQPNTLLGRMG